MAQPYVLPNRKAFADSIVRIFRKYRDKVIDLEDEEEICRRQGDSSKSTTELLDHQKIIRDYLLMETPYRGLLLYHGLGSGKTCSSIGVAESLLSTKKVYVLTPASLQQNYREEISKCGDPIYRFEQYWEVKSIRSPEDREMAKGMGLSDEYLDQNGRFFITVPNRVPNFKTLELSIQTAIRGQINDILNQRFHFINYNGLTSTNIDSILTSETMFDDCVIIIDEVHNLVGAVVNESQLRGRLYNMIYKAKNSKVVCLSGTPIINNPVEIAYLMNLIRGPIERVTIFTKQSVSWDEGMMTAFLRKILDIDTIEYNSVKRAILLTRNPPFFESSYNDKGERIAVKYNKDFPQEPDIKKWVLTWKSKFETEFGGTQLDTEPEKLVVEQLQCLPTDTEEFMKTFIDGLNVKNALMFSKRIQGLVSYFRTANEQLLPKRIDEDKTLTKIPMSDEQFLRYLEARKQEIDQEKSRSLKRNADLSKDYGTYHIKSRLACNYAVPPELKVEVSENASENDATLSNPEILEKLKKNPDKYLSETGLAIYSPKMLAMYKDLKEAVGEKGKFNNQFVYSYFEALQGLGIFSAVLEANGFQRYRIIKENGLWVEDPNLKPGVPAFAFYTGKESDEERKLYRQIFNDETNIGGFPASLRDSIKEKKLCVLMATKAGAEGINLKKVKNVYIMESHWNPGLIQQAIGRAIRMCSHIDLPPDQRTVKVKIYLTIFSTDQSTSSNNNVVLIRRADMILKRYDGGEPRETFMSSDEYLWEVSYEKDRIIKNISQILKQSAIDCEIHRKLHSKEQPVIQCLRFDSTVSGEDLAFGPSYKTDERDTFFLRNLSRKKRRLQKIKAKEIVFLIDPDTNQVFDLSIFDDSKRLIQIGLRTAPGEIRFFTS